MIKIVKKIISKEKKYFFALSMGTDSVAGYMYLLNKNYNIQPIHFNHNLRAQNQLMEEKFIDLCEKTNKKPIIGYGNKLKTELDCRNARLDFYENYCENQEVITAHHLNDFVENYLLNCFRGIPNNKIFQIKSEFEKFSIIHPFLLTRKKDFVQYLERNKLTDYIIEDESNDIIKGSRRNWIRNKILPEMKKNKISLEKFAKKNVLNLIEKYDKLQKFDSFKERKFLNER
jgi:tRNA(Ile)-lysidine synthetase-like protein